MHRFPANAANLLGTAVEGNWSLDGRYAVFRYVSPAPGDNAWNFLWMDMACPPEGDCAPHEIALDQNLELFKACFAPAGDRILFTGSDTSGTGKPDLFLLEFDPAGANSSFVNLTANSSGFADDVGVSPAVWAPDGSIFTLCTDRGVASMFCPVDPNNGDIRSGAGYTEHIFQYQLTPSGKQVLAVVIDHAAPGKGLLELHLFDLDGHAGPALATDRLINVVAMSLSEQYLAYVPEYADELRLIDLLSGNTTQVYTSAMQWSLTWAGWAP